ncbi:MAG: cysteine protease [Prevotella sp.]|nr:cysteine protease [Prevotella sp.]
MIRRRWLALCGACIVLFMGVVLLLPSVLSCSDKVAFDGQFTIDHLNKYTPVKDQGRNQICWIYATLSAIETTHLSLGDSVHLSPYFPLRNYLWEQARQYWSDKDEASFTSRSTALTAIRLLQQYGAMPYDSYHRGEKVNINVLTDKTSLLAKHSQPLSKDFDAYSRKISDGIDDALGYPSHHVFMFGMEYTPHEFARSVCAPDEYVGYTSFLHHPFYESFALEVPDNIDGSEYYNIPIDELTDMVCNAVIQGYGVCWEGDISEPGFSFGQGFAVVTDEAEPSNVQEQRQKEFNKHKTTDDHCMAIVGLAHDDSGKQYLIMKNSWGKDNPYDGLMYMSIDYFKLKTIAVVMPKVSPQSTSRQHRQDREQYICWR